MGGKFNECCTTVILLKEAAEPNEPKNGGRDAKTRNLQMVTVAY